MVAADFCQVSIPSGYGFRESLVPVERAKKGNSPEKRLAVVSENIPPRLLKRIGTFKALI
jgi:hypothetical protein